MDFKFDSNRSYVKAFQKFLLRRDYEEHSDEQKLPFFTTSNYSGVNCIEFQNMKGVEFFNKTSVSDKLKESLYYPKSRVIKNVQGWEKLKLEDDKYYFIKPKYGSQSKNISVYYNKEFIVDQSSFDFFPVIVQDEVVPKLENGFKVDYRVYILYLKEDNKISVFYYPHLIKRVCKVEYENKEDKLSYFSQTDNTNEIIKVEEDENLENCLRETNAHFLTHFNSESYSKLEYFVVGCDIIQDNEDKYWVMEVNWDPAFIYNKEVHKIHNDLINDLIDCAENHFKTGTIILDKFKQLL